MKKIKLFKDLEEYLGDVEKILPDEKEFLNSKTLQYSISMLMMNIANTCLDLGSELINLKQLGYPETYREIFTILEKNKLIAPSLAVKMKNLVGLRNLLAHEYGKINMELLYEQAKELAFIEDFIKKAIKNFE